MEYVICTWNISLIRLWIISSQLHASCMTLLVKILKVLYFCILLLECPVVVLVSWFCPRWPFLFWFCWPIILVHWSWAIGACCSYHLVPFYLVTLLVGETYPMYVMLIPLLVHWLKHWRFYCVAIYCVHYLEWALSQLSTEGFHSSSGGVHIEDCGCNPSSSSSQTQPQI